MFKFVGRNVLTGLIAVLPVLLTAYLLYWFVMSMEALLGEVIRWLLPADFYRPGMGVVMAVIVLFFIGLLMHAYLVRRMFDLGEQILYRVPLIKSVYRAIRDFFDYFSPTNKREFQQVVSVTIGDTGMEIIGFVTQAKGDSLPEDFRGDDSVLVYLPLSYMIGGYTVLMPRRAVRPLNMSLEEAMRFTLTAGVTGANATARRGER